MRHGGVSLRIVPDVTAKAAIETALVGGGADAEVIDVAAIRHILPL